MASAGLRPLREVFETVYKFVFGSTALAFFLKACSWLSNPSSFSHIERLSEMENAMAPPSRKHQISHLPEPIQNKQRKTLAERAGEPIAAPSRNISTSSSLRIPSNQSKRTIPNQSIRTTSGNSYLASLTAPTGKASGKSIPIPRSLTRPKSTRRADGKLAPLSAEAQDHTTSGMQLSFPSHPGIPHLKNPLEPTQGRFRDAQIAYPPKRRAARTEPSTTLAYGGRDFSISSSFAGLRLDAGTSLPHAGGQKSPSRLPRPVTPARIPSSPFLRPTSRQKSPRKLITYLTRDSNIEAWDVELKVDEMEHLQKVMAAHFNESAGATNSIISTMKDMQDQNAVKDEQIKFLLQQSAQQSNNFQEQMRAMQSTLKSAAEQSAAESSQMASMQDDHKFLQEQLNILRGQTTTSDKENAVLQAKLAEASIVESMNQKTLAEFKQEVSRLRADIGHRDATVSEHKQQIAEQKQEVCRLRADVDKTDTATAEQKEKISRLRDDVEKREATISQLRKEISATCESATSIQASKLALQAKIDYLESDNKSQSQAYAQMEQSMQEAIQKSLDTQALLRQEETLRRELHNKYQDLKGNIRVFCRVRAQEAKPEKLAQIEYPNLREATEINLTGPEKTSSIGTVTTENHAFKFDKVFNPTTQNEQIFEEIGQLIQSAIDGFNVCIFAYGQTGSGKTFTMSAEDGMIPRALRQIYSKCKELEERGWRYDIQGSFVEIYNDNIKDLLGESKGLKHDIHHQFDTFETTVTNVTTMDLNSPNMVETMLTRAMKKRSVAATKANEHSSRSHSIFILKLAGENTVTGEKSRGTLNLVDLAGSERLGKSQAEGARLEETKAINTSLSCLGNVIAALRNGAFVPYRDCTLTYLLQCSIGGGNSKTLMFVMASPLKEHLGETLASLEFANKVQGTHIGAAKKKK